MRVSPWVVPVLYGVIFMSAGFGGFVYTDRYPGWGHYHANAVPVGFGLGAVAAFIAAIIVSEMDPRRTLGALGTIAALSSLAALAAYLLAP